jgi:hypothetical protein
MSINNGQITLSDQGRIEFNNGSSAHHGIIITVDYRIDDETQLMNYKVTLGERVVKQVYDVPYSFEELYTIATEILFKKMYRGLPDLKVKVEMGEPHG